MSNSRILSIIAYYLSEYDMHAVTILGYNNRSEAFRELSIIFKKENNYLKLRRDEFDALPESASSRNGWKNREPAKDVVELASYLKKFSFEELTEVVRSLCENAHHQYEEHNAESHDILPQAISEIDIENILNFKDSDATIRIRMSNQKVRVYNTSIIAQLKKLYGGQCQICGKRTFEEYDVDLCEAHHIDYFSSSHNNDASNIIILCPNHRRLIHKLNPTFNYLKNEYIFSDGTKLKIKLNVHLSIKE